MLESTKDEALRTLTEENERTRLALKAATNEILNLKMEQKTKEVDVQLKMIAHQEQESKDLVYLAALESEYERIRLFVCDVLKIPNDAGAPPADDRRRLNEVDENGLGTAIEANINDNLEMTENQEAAIVLLRQSETRLLRAKGKTAPGSVVQVKDFWDEVNHFLPPLDYDLNSAPCKRLLADWAQGNSRKRDFMNKWLSNVVQGGDIDTNNFPAGVELT